MKQGIFDIVSNYEIAQNTYKMTLSGDASDFSAPGQFLNIQLDGFFLRRPISVYDYSADGVTIVYKTVGRGTEAMAAMKSGSLDILTGLGNGFDTSRAEGTVLLLGGGVGTAPLYRLCKDLSAKGFKIRAVLGFNTAAEVFCEDELRFLGAEVYVCTVDGSYGEKGFVTSVMDGLEYGFFYVCGPMPMLKAVNSCARTDGQFSFEERMGCGFGACMGCSCETKYGAKRICRDGPVLNRDEILSF